MLVGKLSEVRSNHPNPEFNGKSLPVIFLMKPIDVWESLNDSNMFNEVERNVTKVQLGYSVDLRKKITAFKNKKVSISCSDLFHNHAAHHTTEVLCTVKDIDLLK